VLKPLNKEKHFFREVNFYRTMKLMGKHWMQSAEPFVPTYHGLFAAEAGAQQQQQLYLGLADLTSVCVKPCAIDIKMGTQTYEPGADAMKKRREINKCPHQAEVGFRITGK